MSWWSFSKTAPPRWYYLDALNQPCGPLSTEEIRALCAKDPWLEVAREGEDQWLFAPNFEELRDDGVLRIRISAESDRDGVRPARRRTPLDRDGQPTNRRFNRRQNAAKAADELLGICKGMLVDGVVTPSEADYLRGWLADHREHLEVWPLREISRRLDLIYADGIVSDTERADLQETLSLLIGKVPTVEDAATYATRLPFDLPAPDPLLFEGRTFCVTGRFVFGPRDRVEEALAARGARIHPRIVGDLDVLLVGTLASRDWKQGSYGTKIEAAIKLRTQGRPLKIVGEEHWVRFIGS